MTPIKMSNETRAMAKPENWDDSKGECLTLSIEDVDADNGLHYMVSAWKPDPDEYERIVNGEPIYLWITGYEHPVVSLAA